MTQRKGSFKQLCLKYDNYKISTLEVFIAEVTYQVRLPEKELSRRTWGRCVNHTILDVCLHVIHLP